jgi:ethanolaminephosphotransferase
MAGSHAEFRRPRPTSWGAVQGKKSYGRSNSRFKAKCWLDIVANDFQFMREAQENMSGAASNYDVSRLFLGSALALLVCCLGFFALPKFGSLSPGGVCYALTLALYVVLMFASSYVEEEHNFWYWATSGWLFVVFINCMRKDWYSRWIFHPAIVTMVLHRVIRRWNQTGQKYAGADDIVNSGIFHGNSFVLWALIGATYMDVTLRLARHVARSLATFDDSNARPKSMDIESTDTNRMMGTIAVLPLTGTAFVFKLAFTAKDAPELTTGMTGNMMDTFEGLDLVSLARMVFGGLVLSGGWIAFAEWHRSAKRARRGRTGNGGKSSQNNHIQQHQLTHDRPRSRFLRPGHPFPPHSNQSPQHPTVHALPTTVFLAL